MFSILSHFSDISDHNSQVINIDRDDISQTNDVSSCSQHSCKNIVIKSNDNKVASQLGENNTGDDLYRHIVSCSNNNITHAGHTEQDDLDVNKNPLVREFGFILEIISNSPKGQKVKFCNPSQWLCDMHEVRNMSKPNYQEAHVMVPSGLHVQAWQQLVRDYDFKILAEYIEFRFPLGVDFDIFTFSLFTKNHAFALQRPQAVDKYFQIEKKKKSIYGPFKKSHFDQTHYSPLIARDKPDGGDRIIINLSWSIGQSVNSCVAADIYDNIPFTLKYPTIDQVVPNIQEYGLTIFCIRLI